MVDPIWLEILGISEDEMKKTKTVKYEGENYDERRNKSSLS